MANAPAETFSESVRAKLTLARDAVRATPDKQEMTPEAAQKLDEELGKMSTKVDLLKSVDAGMKTLKEGTIAKQALALLKEELEKGHPVIEGAKEAGKMLIDTGATVLGTVADTTKNLASEKFDSVASAILPKEAAEAAKYLPDYAKLPLVGGAIWAGAKGVKWLLNFLGFEKSAEMSDKVGSFLGKMTIAVGAFFGAKDLVNYMKGEEKPDPTKTTPKTTPQTPTKTPTAAPAPTVATTGPTAASPAAPAAPAAPSATPTATPIPAPTATPAAIDPLANQAVTGIAALDKAMEDGKIDLAEAKKLLGDNDLKNALRTMEATKREDLLLKVLATENGKKAASTLDLMSASYDPDTKKWNTIGQYTVKPSLSMLGIDSNDGLLLVQTYLSLKNKNLLAA